MQWLIQNRGVIMADFDKLTIEDCLKYYQAGLEVEISNGEVIGFNEVERNVDL